MKKNWLLIGLAAGVFAHGQVSAHCQMPCGIYHDEMVYDQIDQYAETMYKAVAVLNDNHFESIKDKNDFVRWVVQKETASDEIAHVICKYFLQQKIKPGDDDTTQKLIAAHKLLFGIVQIKQNTDIKVVESFADEWDKFKLMFHVDGYECKVDTLRVKKRQEEQRKLEEAKLKNGTTPAAQGATASVPFPAAPAVPVK